jgi:DNA replication protein DnaC
MSVRGVFAKCHAIGRHFNGWAKSHLASALAHSACQQGFNVLVVNAHKMLQHLNGGGADNTFDRRLATYLRPDLLVIDDFGLKPLAPPAPQDLYDVIAERYEQGSILLCQERREMSANHRNQMSSDHRLKSPLKKLKDTHYPASTQTFSVP